jgi:uncharacterized protein
MSYWPWWLGGLALATVAIGFWRAIGRLLGVSGSFANVLRSPSNDGGLAGADAAAIEAAMMEATREAFGADALDAASSAAPEPGAPPAITPTRLSWSANATLLCAMVAGGAIGALSRGAWGIRLDFGPDFARLIGTGWRAWAALLGGGVLVGFGTAMAGGCTSGHGLCGTSRLQRGSLVATCSFFGAAVGVSFLLKMVSP